MMSNQKEHKMNKIILSILFLSGCGYESKNNELVGQVKRVVEKTPILCSDWTQADVSLGVMRNGTGSVSKEDTFLTVVNKQDADNLKQAAETGIPVKVIYNVKRIAFCTEKHIVTKVEPAL